MSEIFEQWEIHDKDACQPPCPFHSPSDHPLKDARIHIRGGKMLLVERICQHGVGHDDPDSVAYFHSKGEMWAGVHGCDGCCVKNKENNMWNADLIRLIQECRSMNEGMRFGQLIFNAVSLHDKANYTSEHDSDFHSRLFNIYDEELVAAVKEWLEFLEQQQKHKD